MTASLLIARLLLAAVFLIAGAAKLADRTGSRAALASFGVPPSLAALLGVGLPLIELAVAVALLPAVSSGWGAFGALVLLGVFLVGIANVLLRGRETDCHCFGQLHSAPVGWSTLARNAVLALMAAFVVVGQRGSGSPSYQDWFGGFGTAEWVALSAAGLALTLLAAGTWFGMHLMRQHGRILLRLDALERELAERGLIAAPGVKAPTPDGVPFGAPAPAFEAPTLHGHSTSLGELLAPGLPLMLIFTHPACAPCTALLPEIAGWQRAHGAKLTVGLISQGSIEENRARFAKAGIQQVLVQRAREIGDAYATDVTPSAVLISREGTVASGIAQGAFAIRDLLGSIVRGSLTNPRPSGVSNGHDTRKRPARHREQQDVSTPLVSFDGR